MIVLVNGLGNIGQTVLAFLVKYQELLQVDKIYALKNRPQAFEDYSVLAAKVHKLCFSRDEVPIDHIQFVFDCTASGFSKQNKHWYESFPKLMGANAQGTEHHFGKSIMLGLNNNHMAEYKYQHVVSCNTHGILSLLRSFSPSLEQVNSADFVVVRRSEDLGNHERLVSANVVARHRDDTLGTHHAEDATKLLHSLGIHISLCSSDITTPSQLMHAVRFSIHTQDSEKTSNPYVGSTQLFDSNKVFEAGRRHGFQGRIYHHAIIVENNMLTNEESIKGWAFIPQEGNTIFSTLAGYCYRCFPYDNAKEIIKKITEENLLF